MAFSTSGPAQVWAGTGNGGWAYLGATTGSTAWMSWNQSYTTTGTTSASTAIMAGNQWTTWNYAYEETAQQAAAREAQEAAQRRQWAELRERALVLNAARAAARERAEELLAALLSDEQAASRRERGFFAVRGSRSGRTYRIHSSGAAGNVDRLDADGRREMTFCCHPPGALPLADVHLAQMLQLVADEDEFLRVANAHRVRQPQPAAA